MLQEELGIEFTQLGKEIKEWAQKNIGPNFEFRENQLDIIHSIISNILDKENGVPTHIIEAPTGSGKSLILVISAGVLADYYNKTSYILCSDLSLWKQYDKLFKECPKIAEKFGSIKGQSGNNYECSRNHNPIKLGECRFAKISWDKLFNSGTAKQLKFECAYYCPYVKARKKALFSKVTLMTYQLYVRSINNTTELNNKTFSRRDVVFCDECHNIPAIVQSTFGLTIKEKFIENYLSIWKYAISQNEGLFKDEITNKLYESAKSIAENESDLVDQYNNIFESLKANEADNENIIGWLNNLLTFSKKFSSVSETIIDQLSTAVQNKDYIQKHKITAFEKCEWLENFINSLEYYLTVIKETGTQYLVRNINENKYEEDQFGRPVLAKYPWDVSFSCALENFLVQSYFLMTSDNQVMTSATVGGHSTFIENCGIGAHLYDVLPSTFDYDNSPIYYLGRWKMSNQFKSQNFPKVKSAIYELCERFKDKKGIIQTWTYENAKEIYNNAPEELQTRMLLYSGSTAKQELIDYHKTTEVPTILIGPTLNEGIDLPGDECRFIIMMKMPYPYMGDNLTKAKMELFPEWYENETAKTVIQSIGRGNRYHDDWCITYILDGCFGQLYNKTKDQFPMNIRNRLKFYA